jgi:hypothetical protein
MILISTQVLYTSLLTLALPTNIEVRQQDWFWLGYDLESILYDNPNSASSHPDYHMHCPIDSNVYLREPNPANCISLQQDLPTLPPTVDTPALELHVTYLCPLEFKRSLDNISLMLFTSST